jgi:hypothetical protein
MGMLKIFFFPLAFCLACYGLWEFLLSYQYKDKQDKSKDWIVTEARLIERGDGIKPPGVLGITPAAFICILISKPFVQYKYTVNGKKYEERQQLPPCLTFVRLVISKDIEEDVKPDPSELKDTDLIDPQTGQLKSNLSDIMEERFESYLPKIQIKYNPGDPQESLTDPDKLKGTETLFWSGIWSIVLSAVAVGAAKFHEWVTKPTEEEFDPFAKSSRAVKY